MKVPRDEVAEKAVVGSLLWEPCPELGEVLSADRFYDRRLARLYVRLMAEVAPSPAEVPTEPRRWMGWVFPRQRAALAALGATTPADTAADRELIDRCLDVAACGATQTKKMALRVDDAARRRELMRVLSDAYNALGTGSSLSEVTTQLADV